MNDDASADRRPWTIFLIFLRLGLTSFGGPIAHLGYFRDEFVTRRRWLSEQNYADWVALCQFLPGPASSQVGIALGLSRGGYSGALAAWAGFTLPSAMALILLASGVATLDAGISPGVLQGLKIVAVAVVVQAVWGMARTLCPDAPRLTLMAGTACFVLWQPSAGGQIGAIGMAAVLGSWLFKPAPGAVRESLPMMLRRRVGAIWLAVFAALLIGLPTLAAFCPSQTLAMVNVFFRAGALVFGGGHVVLPLLQADVVPNGWVDNSTFLAGYGAAQAVPGPLFTFAAFLGASIKQAPSGWLGGLICLLSIFTPAFLLVVGALPFWEHLRRSARTQAALSGVNAAVVGLLLAALYQPIWMSVIYQPRDFGLALVALMALVAWKCPPWLVVLGSGVAGWLFGGLG